MTTAPPINPPAISPPVAMLRLRNPFAVIWTRDDCAKLEADGYLTYRYELIEGDLIRKMPQNVPHRIAVTALIVWLCSVFGQEFVQTQATVDVSPEDNPTSEPEPDASVLSVPLRTFVGSGQRNPTPAQTRMVVEVSDSTLNFDLTAKAGLYARAGIPEYRVIDLNNRQVHLLRDPANGVYQNVTVHNAMANISCLAAPMQTLAVAALLP